MPPRLPILAQSENKSKFLERLGISDRTEEGKRMYAMMKEEAIAGRARMSENPRSLLPQLQSDPTIQKPYSNTQISESAMHHETLMIYYHARPETKRYYDLGHYHEGPNEENWVIKWLLWHVFRYRDNRNRGRGTPTWGGRESISSQGSGSRSGAHSTSPTTGRSARRDSASGPGYYDPVRDAHRHR